MGSSTFGNRLYAPHWVGGGEGVSDNFHIWLGREGGEAGEGFHCICWHQQAYQVYITIQEFGVVPNKNITIPKDNRGRFIYHLLVSNFCTSYSKHWWKYWRRNLWHKPNLTSKIFLSCGFRGGIESPIHATFIHFVLRERGIHLSKIYDYIKTFIIHNLASIYNTNISIQISKK